MDSQRKIKKMTAKNKQFLNGLWVSGMENPFSLGLKKTLNIKSWEGKHCL